MQFHVPRLYLNSYSEVTLSIRHFACLFFYEVLEIGARTIETRVEAATSKIDEQVDMRFGYEDQNPFWVGLCLNALV